MSKQKKLITLMLSLAIICGSLFQTACGVKEESSDKTVIRVMFYNAGFGREYMDDAEKEFESIFADRSFEEGKTGVDVIIDGKKQIGTDIQSNIAFSNTDVYFTEQIYYHEFVAQSLIADINDVVNDKGAEFGENESVLDKMSDTVKNAYTYSDGKFYALPTYYNSVGINYNIDLFDNYNLYFAAEKNNGNKGFIKTASDKKSSGPDGEYDTYDDGLPATYDEFYALCERMLDYNITPISWGDLTYVNALLTELQADYEGTANMCLNFNFNGTAKNLVKSINTDGTLELEEKAITEDNGYEVYKQAGRYYALSFFEKLIKSGYVNTASLSSSTAYSYTSAQQDFIMSGIKGKKEIGMLVEGCWWNNEAIGIFNELSAQFGSRYSKDNMRFGFMPLPKATQSLVGKGNCTLSELGSGIIINSKTQGAKLDVAKLFVRYMFTDKQMNNFIRRVGVPFVYDFKVDADYSATYGKSILDYCQASEIILPFSSSMLYIKNASTFNVWFKFWDTSVNGYSYTNMNPLIDEKVTATQYFNGLYDYRVRSWNSLSK